MTKVLIIEDDTIFGEMLRLYLCEENFTVHYSNSIQSGLHALQTNPPDIILLDLMLPDLNEQDPCSILREHTCAPIIVISTQTKVSERIHALATGADDFLCKPFSMQEMKARIEAILRRSRLAAPLQDKRETQSGTDQYLRLDTERKVLVMEGEPVDLTFSEYEIMKLFFSNPEHVFSRDELINAVRGIDSYVNDRAIDVHITNLRKKFEHNPKEPQYIKTVWGMGYKFVLTPHL